MARNEIDPIDVGALVLWPIAAGMVLGVWTFGLSIFGGYDFTKSLLSAAGVSISVAFVAAMGSLAWIVVTNELDGSDYEEWEWYSILGSFAIVPAYVLIPAVQTLVDSSDVIKVFVWLAIAIVAVYLSYTE